MKFASIIAPALAAGALVLAVPGTALAASSVTATPATGLTNGSTITVAGKGFPAGLTLYIVECHALSATGCDTAHLGTATTSAAGDFSAKFKVFTGTVGDGACNAGSSCLMVVSDAAKTASGSAKIAFASASAPASTPTTAATTPSTSGSGTTAAPSSVAAGTGGDADHNGIPSGAVLLAIAGGLAVAGGSLKLARR